MILSIANDIWQRLNNYTYGIKSANSDKVWLEFDTIDECQFHGSATVAKYPLENNTYYTDYKYSSPDDLMLKGAISVNSLIRFGDAEYNLDGITNKTSLVELIRNQCSELCRNMILLDIQTRNSGLRRNFTMNDFVINETPGNYNMLEVDMSFTEVLLLTAEGTMLRNVADSNMQKAGIVETRDVNLGRWWM